MNIDLLLQQDETATELMLVESDLINVIKTALCHVQAIDGKGFDDVEISIICVDEPTSQTLNHQYRQKNKPTNVLSFVSDVPDEIINELPCYPLGDLVICLPVVLKEASEQQKTPIAHFNHLVVHGVLHLLGFDHEISEQDAAEMESLEIAILAKLGIANPYADIYPTDGHSPCV